MRKKTLWCRISAMLVIMLIAGPAFGQREEVEGDEVVDISEEVLAGPSDLNPEKILGPGGVGIKTSKNLLMSFGATVRFIPTSESNWDFGLHKEVPGYFDTTPLKDFAQTGLTNVTTVQNLYENANTLSDTVANNRSDAAVISSYKSLSDAYYNANNNLQSHPMLGPAVGMVTQGLQTLDATADAAVNSIALPVALPVVSAAATAAVAAVQPGADLGSIQQAAATAGQAAADQTVAAITDPTQQAIARASADAAVSAAAASAATSAASTYQAVYTQAIMGGMAPADADTAARAAAQTAASAAANNSAAGAASDAAEAAVIKAGSSTLVNNTNALTATVASSANNDPNATAADIAASTAYFTALKATADGFSPYYLANTFLKAHSNESGAVKDGYIRNETKMYFNVMPSNKKWSFYAALEYDRPIDTTTVDNRGGKDVGSSNFGLERLNASYEIVDGLRFHAGWDIWGMDIIEAATMVYGDDNPGFWIKGDYDTYDFSLAWLKLENNDFQISAADYVGETVDGDRDLVAGYFDYMFREKDKFRFFAGWDRIRNVSAADLTGVLASEAGLADYGGIYGNNGVRGAKAKTADTDAFTLGGYYLGNFGMFELMAEAAYKFGNADDTGLQGVDNGVFEIQYDDFDISAYALALDIGMELKDLVGWYSLKPHIGWMYTSGDDDPNDDKLSGWTGITSAQRFSRAWGGENTIIGDSNMVLGSALYGYIPEYHGNGTPVFTGGFQNAAGTGNGRGDNPGLNMLSIGITMRPKIFLIYRTNVNIFSWNEDFFVANMVAPIGVSEDGTSLVKSRYTKVDAGYVGTEWDNEITLALSKNVFVKGQCSFFFAGSGVEDVTYAYSGGTATCDDTAVRLAAELIWNF